MIRTLSVTLCALVALGGHAFAGDKDRSTRRSKERLHRVAPKPISGSKVEQNVELTTRRIQWHDDLASLRELAQKQGKMILWMQIVGELGGGL